MNADILSEFRLLLAPGLHNSGPGHWQSRWQRLFPAFERVEQDHWDQPDLPRWSARLDQLRSLNRRPTLIVAHSFGCLATVHSVARNPAGVAGVLLVAPADPDKFAVADLLPHGALPCPAIVIASSDDPWMAAPRAAHWAAIWHGELINAGALGHINADSGLGDWSFGLEKLQFIAELAHNNRLLAGAAMRAPSGPLSRFSPGLTPNGD